MENIMTPEHTKLNMGCGFKKLNDHWNVDVESKCNPDEVLDFEVTPWPYEYNFFDRMNLKRTEVIKLSLFSLVIALGISIDRMLTYYLSKYIGDNILTDFQEFLLRVSYPITIFLLLWIFKAI